MLAAWSFRAGSNRWPARYECAALPTEPRKQIRVENSVVVTDGYRTKFSYSVSLAWVQEQCKEFISQWRHRRFKMWIAGCINLIYNKKAGDTSKKGVAPANNPGSSIKYNKLWLEGWWNIRYTPAPARLSIINYVKRRSESYLNISIRKKHWLW